MNKLLFLTAVIVFTSSCANLNSIYRTDSFNNKKVSLAFIDAKQRAITINTDRPGHTVVCPERSPDALSVAAASGNASVTLPNKAGGALSGSDTEQGAFDKFSSQLTEAQQSLLYWFCEYNANGQLSSDQMSNELRRFQNTMVAMLAIEQLTGVAKPTVVMIGDKGSDQNSASTPDPAKPTKVTSGKDPQGLAATAKSLKTQSDQATAQANTDQKLADDLKASLDKETDKTSQTALTKQSDDATAKATTSKKNAQDAKTKSDAAAKAVQSAAQTPPAKDKAATDSADSGNGAIANAVYQIVYQAINHTATSETCLKFLFESEDHESKAARLNPNVNVDLADFCLNHLKLVDNFKVLYLTLPYSLVPGEQPPTLKLSPMMEAAAAAANSPNCKKDPKSCPPVPVINPPPPPGPPPPPPTPSE